jgi:hypothetical protein
LAGDAAESRRNRNAEGNVTEEDRARIVELAAKGLYADEISVATGRRFPNPEIKAVAAAGGVEIRDGRAPEYEKPERLRARWAEIIGDVKAALVRDILSDQA